MGGYAKIYDSLLDSSLWKDHVATRVFETALLMARPAELREPTPTIQIGSLEPGGYTVPAGRYGIVAAASVGILRRALVSEKRGMRALKTLAAPDSESRSEDHDGRRMVRIDGGFVVLNFIHYRDWDVTGAKRQQRFRERHGKKGKKGVTGRNGVTERYVTQAGGRRHQAGGIKQEEGETPAARADEQSGEADLEAALAGFRAARDRAAEQKKPGEVDTREPARDLRELRSKLQTLSSADLSLVPGAAREFFERSGNRRNDDYWRKDCRWSMHIFASQGLEACLADARGRAADESAYPEET